MRVLIVDDDPNCRQILELMLTREGFTAFTAVNGAEGVRLAQSVRPDLIVMDILMPVMSGTEAATELKSDPEFAGVPIVAVTALAFEEDRRAALAAGFDFVVTKPFSRRQLIEGISRFFPDRLVVAQAAKVPA